MKRLAAAVFTLGAVALLIALVPGPVLAADAPADRVLAMYFHRTQRCPTCLKMGSYSEEAVKQGFAQQIKDGKVAFYYIDFQNPKNAALAKAYKVEGPALIVAKVVGKKVVEFKDLDEIWMKVRDKPAFLKYVREHVAAYLQ